MRKADLSRKTAEISGVFRHSSTIYSIWNDLLKVMLPKSYKNEKVTLPLPIPLGPGLYSFLSDKADKFNNTSISELIRIEDLFEVDENMKDWEVDLSAATFESRIPVRKSPRNGRHHSIGL